MQVPFSYAYTSVNRFEMWPVNYKLKWDESFAERAADSIFVINNTECFMAIRHGADLTPLQSVAVPLLSVCIDLILDLLGVQSSLKRSRL